MKLLKVLNRDLTSPYQGMEYEAGKKYTCENFDTSDKVCSRGFYAVDFNGLVYAINKDGNEHDVWDVEVGGRSKEFDQFMRRYEEITIVRKLSQDEVLAGLEACRESDGYKTYEACYPINPFSIEPKIAIDDAIQLLEKWKTVGSSVVTSVWDSVWSSVKESVWSSVWESVKESVWDSVWDSVWFSVKDSVWSSVWSSFSDIVFTYISSLFPNIKRWKGIDHEEGVNPFQCGIDLWKAGYAPSFDGKIWRLHTKDGIVWKDV